MTRHLCDPFKIEGPAVVSFSGGRTSGYRLWRILQAHEGRLPDDVLVIFQNTGKEMPQTLDFIHECSRRWLVPIVWLEFDGFVPPGRAICNFKIVNRESASADGTPFLRLIDELQFLPNPVARVCTSYLKIKTMISYLKSIGWDEWDVVLGIRADEPRRVARLRAPGRDMRGGNPSIPLANAGISSGQVGDFWRAQEFDLRLPNANGKTAHGNCDLCFLKGPKQILSLIREDPNRAIWWMNAEHRISKATGDALMGRFRNDRPTYQQLHEYATTQGELYAFDDEPLTDCACTD